MILLALLGLLQVQTYQEGQTATNFQTGERIVLRDGKWVPVPPCPSQTDCKPRERDWFDEMTEPVAERLGPGPHTLVISDGSAMTRMEYKSGPACQRARDAVRRQAAPPPVKAGSGIIYGPPRIVAMCVPR